MTISIEYVPEREWVITSQILTHALFYIKEYNVDYMKDLEIDESKLDLEWLKHSGLFMKYQEQAIFAETKLDKLKEQLNVQKAEFEKFEAELELQIRKNPDLFGIEKITEGTVKAAKLADKGRENELKKIQNLNMEIVDQKEKMNLYYGATKAFVQRKSALENLVQLYFASYYSQPSENKKSIKDKILDNVQDQVRDKLNNKE